MCGRYQFFDDENPDIAALIEQLRGHMDPAEFGRLSLFEVFPGQRVPAYVFDRKNNTFRLLAMDWGLPGRDGSLLINARSETVRKEYISPQSIAAAKDPRIPRITIMNPGRPLFPIRFSIRQPPAPPMHMTPGIPRFRCPAFSVRISPVEP